MYKKFFLILLKAILFLLIGLVAGYGFFYFLKDASVFIIDKLKFLQNILGIRQFEAGMSVNYVFFTILVGNLLSTAGYFSLGFLKTTLPASAVSGFFIVIFLLSGTIRHGTAVPIEVMLLASLEIFYRILSLSTGEYISFYRFKNKVIPITSFSLIFVLYATGIYYEMSQLFGSFF